MKHKLTNKEVINIVRNIREPSDLDYIRSGEQDDVKLLDKSKKLFKGREDIPDNQMITAIDVAVDRNDLDFIRGQRKKKSAKPKSKRKICRCKK
jgi:hypothetical protein